MYDFVCQFTESYYFCSKDTNILLMTKPKDDIKSPIGQYFHTLWYAIIGRDPHAKERETLNDAIGILQERITKLKDLYANVVDKWSAAERLNDKMNSENAKLKNDIGSYQILVENLRSSIRDKEYQLSEYIKEVNRLQKTKQ